MNLDANFWIELERLLAHYGDQDFHLSPSERDRAIAFVNDRLGTEIKQIVADALNARKEEAL